MRLSEYRKPEHEINNIFIERWSPRAMSGEILSEDEIMSLFEAARWAPSSYNNQPWKFVYARKNTEYWDKFFNLLIDFNKSWVKDAALLILIISKRNFEYNNKPSVSHSFDTGAAWQNLALQGSINGLVVHAMEGFDYEKAKQLFKIPDDYKIEAMIAVGKPGKKENLPKELQGRESPSSRKKIGNFVSEGNFIQQ
ncbi:MAG: nitroreductase family protein [Candidatus Nanoarchaeia archaeon]|nr:nitroreductase family protein [Candidatus Nanoarchaeia archaeon]